MLISPKKLSSVWRLNPQGVLHIGAHNAEEMSLYYELGWGHMHWVEANPILAKELAQTLDLTHNTIHQCAAWDVDKKLIVFNETTDSQSSSLFRLKQHSVHYPQILHKKTYKVKARRIDCLYSAPPPFTFVNIDVQGAELQAIKGMGDLVLAVDAIYSEVNKEELYEGCATVSEIDAYLKEFGFRRVATRWVLGKGWGDALYINKQRISVTFRKVVLNYTSMTPFYAKQAISIILSKLRLLNLMKSVGAKLFH